MRLIILALIWLFVRSDLSVGVCLDTEQNGLLYNGEPYYNYISYYGTDASEGDMVLTYTLLNPLNDYCDDIVYRLDIVLKGERDER